MADAQIAPVLAELDAMAKTVPLEEPWRAPRALEWDSMTCETFKRGHAPRPGASNLFDLGIEAISPVSRAQASACFVRCFGRKAAKRDGALRSGERAVREVVAEL